MKRKKKPGLPRVTVLAYSKRDLVAFVQSVETLRLLVEDLRAVARDLANATVSVQKKKGGKKPSPATAAADPGTTPVPQPALLDDVAVLKALGRNSAAAGHRQ